MRLVSRSLRWLVTVIALMLAVPLALATCSAVQRHLDEPDALAFDASRWRTESTTTDVRYRMAKDLVDTDALIGTSRDGVVALLGPPDSEPVERLQYGLGGPTSTFGGFTNILAVILDEGVVVDAFIFDD